MRLDDAAKPDVDRTTRQPTARVQDGEFLFDALAPGHYRVRLLGLARGNEIGIVAAKIEVELGQETYVEFTPPTGD